MKYEQQQYRRVGLSIKLIRESTFFIKYCGHLARLHIT
jgi:hypothetical protein